MLTYLSIIHPHMYLVHSDVLGQLAAYGFYLTMFCTNPVVGRYISVQRMQANTQLAFLELQVMFMIFCTTHNKCFMQSLLDDDLFL